MSERPAVVSYIGLGSNLDDPPAQLLQACVALAQLPQTQLDGCSSLWCSAALSPPTEAGYSQEPQPDYVNAVVRIKTALAPLALLHALQEIENAAGRTRMPGQRWAARTLDLDVLLYGDQQINLPELTVPHPRLAERRFVLQPLAQLQPDLRLPGAASLNQLLLDCPQSADALRLI